MTITNNKIVAFLAGLIFPLVIAGVFEGIFELFYWLFKIGWHYGPTGGNIAQIVMGFIYLFISWYVWRRFKKETLKFFLIAEISVAIVWFIGWSLSGL